MDTYHRWMEVVTPATPFGLPCHQRARRLHAGDFLGMQIIGRMHGERSVLQLAYAYEQETRWVARRRRRCSRDVPSRTCPASAREAGESPRARSITRISASTTAGLNWCPR